MRSMCSIFWNMSFKWCGTLYQGLRAEHKVFGRASGFRQSGDPQSPRSYGFDNVFAKHGAECVRMRGPVAHAVHALSEAPPATSCPISAPPAEDPALIDLVATASGAIARSPSPALSTCAPRPKVSPACAATSLKPRHVRSASPP